MDSSTRSTVLSTDAQYTSIDQDNSKKGRSFLWIVCAVIAAMVIIGAATTGYISPKTMMRSNFKAELRGSTKLDAVLVDPLNTAPITNPALPVNPIVVDQAPRTGFVAPVAKNDGDEDKATGPATPASSGATKKSSKTTSFETKTVIDPQVILVDPSKDPKNSSTKKTNGEDDKATGAATPASKATTKTSRKSSNPNSATPEIESIVDSIVISQASVEEDQNAVIEAAEQAAGTEAVSKQTKSDKGTTTGKLPAKSTTTTKCVKTVSSEGIKNKPDKETKAEALMAPGTPDAEDTTPKDPDCEGVTAEFVDDSEATKAVETVKATKVDKSEKSGASKGKVNADLNADGMPVEK